MLAVGQHQLAGGRVDPLDAALRVQRDAPLGEHGGEGIAQHPAGGRHRVGLGCVDVDGGAVAGAAVSQKRFGEERCLVGGGGTLVGQAGHDHRQAAALEPIQRGAGSGRAFQRVDVVGRVGEAGQRVGRQLGTKRDH